MCESVCILMTFTVFYCTFLLIMSVCLYVSVCVCVRAMLPDSNKMMMMINVKKLNSLNMMLEAKSHV